MCVIDYGPFPPLLFSCFHCVSVKCNAFLMIKVLISNIVCMCARVCAVAVAVALVEWCSFYVRTILFLVFFIFCIFIHCNLLIEAGSCKSGEKK